MRVRRILWVWCAALAVLSGAALAGRGPAERTLLAAGGSGGTAASAGTAAPDEVAAHVGGTPPDAEVLGAAASAPAAPDAVAPAPGPSTTARTPTSGPATTARPVAAPASAIGLPPTVVPPPPVALAADGSIPCTVKPVELVRLPNGWARAGSFTGWLSVDNCRPVTGDIVGVRAIASHPGWAMRVSFGDGTSAGTTPGDCSFPSGQVLAEHRYTAPGRYLVEATSFAPCHEVPEQRHRVWIEVSAGAVPQAPGAAPCHGLGPSKPGEPARLGTINQDVPSGRLGTRTATFNRCRVPAGGQSELGVHVWEPSFAVDWGDGSAPQSVDEKGVQGATVLHTYARKGVHVARLWMIIDGQPAAPVAFTVVVT